LFHFVLLKFFTFLLSHGTRGEHKGEIVMVAIVKRAVRTGDTGLVQDVIGGLALAVIFYGSLYLPVLF
jgi:hypothetical protein